MSTYEFLSLGLQKEIKKFSLNIYFECTSIHACTDVVRVDLIMNFTCFAYIEITSGN